MNMENHKEVFREEAYELLADLEKSLLELEQSPDDIELIARIFRAMHTIKGSGSMFGYDTIAAFTHELETVFDLVRNKKLSINKELIDIAFTACDQINSMLEDEESVDKNITTEITNKLNKIISKSKLDTNDNLTEDTPEPEFVPNIKKTNENVIYRISFKPDMNILSFGTNPILLLDELRELGDCTTIAYSKNIPLLNDIVAENCYTNWNILLTTDKGIDVIKDVFIFVDDSCDLSVEVLDDVDMIENVDYKKIGEILIEHHDLKLEDIQKLLRKQKPIGELAVEAGFIDNDKMQSAVMEQKHVRKSIEKRKKAEFASSIRVPSERLDKLVNLVGELVIVQARLNQSVSSKDTSSLLQISEEVEHLSAELREITMSIRMLPIGSIFNKFKRLVRDLSNDQGKEIVLSTEGEETELDKTMIEKLNDPLVHIIRNSIDHGIEAPDERQTVGKPRNGTIHLSATHSGGNMLIQIIDDGKGLNTEKIRAKALDKGVISQEMKLTDKDIYNLIFAPGFSTAEKVTKVSGRGVGMDVVKRNIQELRGSIDVQSKLGKGTTITLKLPLTLGIIEGLLVNIEKDYFVVPLQSIEECVELSRQDVERAHGQHICRVRDELVPYINLREKFEITGKVPNVEQIVILNENDNKIGFVVDEVIGKYQTVIKSMGRMYKNVDGISGATILGDGTVALILDVQRLVYQ